MINGFYAAKSGAISYQTSLDVTANNIANVNTQGYKAQNVTFSELMSTSANGSEILVGNGTRIATITRDTSQGAYSDAGSGLSAMISGNGYYAVQNSDESISYSRSCSFALSNEDNSNYLVTASGGYVLDENMNKIEVSGDNTANSIAKAAIYTFDNTEALVSQGGGKYAVSQNSGEAVRDESAKITITAQELSNVDLIAEMTKMMTAQRGFQFSVKMVQTADEIEQTVNNLRN